MSCSALIVLDSFTAGDAGSESRSGGRPGRQARPLSSSAGSTSAPQPAVPPCLRPAPAQRASGAIRQGSACLAATGDRH